MLIYCAARVSLGWCGCNQSNKRLPPFYRANLAALSVNVVGEVPQCLVPFCSYAHSMHRGIAKNLLVCNLRSTKGKVTNIVVARNWNGDVFRYSARQTFDRPVHKESIRPYLFVDHICSSTYTLRSTRPAIGLKYYYIITSELRYDIIDNSCVLRPQ